MPTPSIGLVQVGASNLSIMQLGSLQRVWAGLEHSAIVHYASSISRACSMIEAGAHEGTLAIMAAKLGCDVYAFEASGHHVRMMERNVALNLASPSLGRVHAVHAFLGDGSNASKAGEAGGGNSKRTQRTLRLDSAIPEGVGVALLKMDIDGDDHRAMLGASALFEQAPNLSPLRGHLAPRRTRLRTRACDTRGACAAARAIHQLRVQPGQALQVRVRHETARSPRRRGARASRLCEGLGC